MPIPVKPGPRWCNYPRQVIRTARYTVRLAWQRGNLRQRARKNGATL